MLSVSLTRKVSLFQGSNAAFDSFLYYGVDEEDGDDYRNFITKEQQQIENSNVRAALELMGVDPRTEVTHLDLALLANTKMFMAQAGVTQHLLKLWKRPSDNDNLVQRHLPALFQIPKVKGYLNLCGFATFIAVYATLLINVPNRGDPQELTAVEGVFWIWTLGLILNEIMEAVGDFDAISDYVRASGNVTDMILISAFLSAFACRIVSSVDKPNPELENIEHRAYAADWMLGLLCGNFILCCVRFLLMLSMVGEIGVVSPSPTVALLPAEECCWQQMVIIMGKIVKHDILPFLVFATTAVVAFEAASLFFAWVLEFPHEIGTFFRMFTGVGKSRPRLLPCWPLA